MRQSPSSVSAARQARARMAQSRRQSHASGPAELGVQVPVAAAEDDPTVAPVRSTGRSRWLGLVGVLLGIALLIPLGIALTDASPGAGERVSSKDVEKAIQAAFKKQADEPRSVLAVQRLMPSVVRVVGFERKEKGKGKSGGDDDYAESGVGTGTVINRQGLILTSLHVVQGMDKIQLHFADGSESEAEVVNTRPEKDLAVLQARVMPEGIPPAVLKGSDRLREGDPVIAIGFPFGVGPSVSSGVISGKDRSFFSPEGRNDMEDLIQFDAAANPGNSGGPLATLDGEVVGVVAGILNPTRHRTFLGIGFAVPIETAANAAGLPPF